jgi:tetratricopeptide (TPR) repeat protein
MHDLALRSLQTALREKPVFDDEKKELLYDLGVVLENLSRHDEAIEQFKAVYEQDVTYRDVAARVDAHYAARSQPPT